MTQETLIYTAKICPYAQRALIALEEAGIKHERYEIDLSNKPSWYNDKVNKASKVPVLVLKPSDSADNGGGEESSGTAKLPESLVIAEYIAEQYPAAGLLPTEPLLKAKQRYAIERLFQLYTPHWMALLREHKAEAGKGLISALEEFQSWLPDEAEGPYFSGKQFSLVDVAASPFIGRLILLSQEGLVPVESGSEAVHDTIYKSGRFTRLVKWWEAVAARPSFSSTFEKDIIVNHYKKLYFNKL